MREVFIDEGGMWEHCGWSIQIDCGCSRLSGAEPCRHCHSEWVEIHTRMDGSTWDERQWTCPRVVVAYNEGMFNSTGVCLDCILEAARGLEVGDGV